jgi:ribonuclease BN (tRNA processing enzyme)
MCTELTDPNASKGFSRRSVIQLAAAAGGAMAATALTAAPASAQTHRLSSTGSRLTLLGTSGGPPPMSGRTGIASSLSVGDRTYLVDLGHGAFQRVHEAGIDPASIRNVFITHLHSDHIADLYQLLWLRFGGVARITAPVHVYGPGRAGALPPVRGGRTVATIGGDNPTPGTVDFIEKSMEATAYDLNMRARDEGWPDIRSVVTAHDIALPDVGANATDNLFPDMEPFPVFEDDRVKVTATLVEHPPVFPSFAFRFDTDESSVVFSGDTTRSDNLIRLATGADYLVHEVIALDWVKTLNVPASLLAHLAESHTDVDTVGALAEAAGARNLVLSHLVPGDVDAVTDGQWRRRAQRGYRGRVHVGRDLMHFDLGRS